MEQQRRSISFGGHAWISSLRYGFPFGPLLGSFVHQYCAVGPNHGAAPQQSSGDGDGATVSSTTNRGGAAATDADARTIVLDDVADDPEISTFSYRHYPCYAGPGNTDAKAAKLLMQRRHDAAEALHCRGSSPSVVGSSSSTSGQGNGRKFHPTLTFDLLQQIRGMYCDEMKSQQAAMAAATTGGLGGQQSTGVVPPAAAGGSPRHAVNRPGDYLSGSNRATSALDEVFLDDAAIYTRALVYVSGGSRLARDWLAGCAALSTSHASLITIAMQHQGTHEDLEDFARYCEIVGHCDEMDCSLLEESRLCERRSVPSTHPDLDLSQTLVSYNAGAARCGVCDGDGLIIDLPVPITPQRQSDMVKRCLIYDALTALHFMEYDADLLDLSRIRAASSYLKLSPTLVEQLREVVLAEHSLIAEKHATIDAPPASAEGAARSGFGVRH